MPQGLQGVLIKTHTDRDLAIDTALQLGIRTCFPSAQASACFEQSLELPGPSELRKEQSVFCGSAHLLNVIRAPRAKLLIVSVPDVHSLGTLILHGDPALLSFPRQSLLLPAANLCKLGVQAQLSGTQYKHAAQKIGAMRVSLDHM